MEPDSASKPYATWCLHINSAIWSWRTPNVVRSDETFHLFSGLCMNFGNPIFNLFLLREEMFDGFGLLPQFVAPAGECDATFLGGPHPLWC